MSNEPRRKAWLAEVIDSIGDLNPIIWFFLFLIVVAIVVAIVEAFKKG